ncbi:MAG: hypothetical protein KME26_20455 [Oscillatoria princeps RMCB-10]|nr:hypothetical protein [Oscillatoria princeps RMCB-10]
MNRILLILQIWSALILAANGFYSTKNLPHSAPSTAAVRLIEMASDLCSPCPSPVPQDDRNQAYKIPLSGVASQKDDSRYLRDRQRGL